MMSESEPKRTPVRQTLNVMYDADNDEWGVYGADRQRDSAETKADAIQSAKSRTDGTVLAWTKGASNFERKQ